MPIPHSGCVRLKARVHLARDARRLETKASCRRDRHHIVLFRDLFEAQRGRGLHSSLRASGWLLTQNNTAGDPLVRNAPQIVPMWCRRNPDLKACAQASKLAGGQACIVYHDVAHPMGPCISHGAQQVQKCFSVRHMHNAFRFARRSHRRAYSRN